MQAAKPQASMHLFYYLAMGLLFTFSMGKILRI